MGKFEYKTYELEEVLSTYININGILIKQSSELVNVNEEEKVDILIERDFLEDVDIPDNESKVLPNERIMRYQRIVKLLKQKYNNRCQLCGYSFQMDNRIGYCEAHHIKWLSKDGSQGPENVIILCANHHRLFHHATNCITIGNLINSKRVIKIMDEQFIVQF